MDASRDDVERSAQGVNPYASPEDGSGEVAPRTKTQWRIIPTAMLTLLSLVCAVVFSLAFIAGVVMTVDIQSLDGETIYSRKAFVGYSILVVSAGGVVGSLIGFRSGWNCWRGNWIATIVQALLFVSVAVTVHFLLELLVDGFRT